MSSTEIKAADKAAIEAALWEIREVDVCESTEGRVDSFVAYIDEDGVRAALERLVRTLRHSPVSAGAEEAASKTAWEVFWLCHEYKGKSRQEIQDLLRAVILSAIQSVHPEIAETQALKAEVYQLQSKVVMEELTDTLDQIAQIHGPCCCERVGGKCIRCYADAALAHAEEVLKPHEDVQPEGPQAERRCAECRFWSTNIGAKKGICSKGGLSTEWKQVCELGFMPRDEAERKD